MVETTFGITGLTGEQVIAARQQFGENKFIYRKNNSFIGPIVGIVKEPMILLLLLASAIYFVSGQPGDGIFLISAVVLVAAISFYQDSRSRSALLKLQGLTQPTTRVIRNNKTEQIPSEQLVIGDSMIVEEGTSIAADAVIIRSNDFSVNESILTGESLPVFKDRERENNLIYSGTMVASGLAIATVTAIGNHTALGKIGKSLESISEEKTPLELQVNNFVNKMAIAGTVVFLVVWILNFWQTHNILGSLLKSLTLAMSILPEEIPVAFTSFMALGAWRLMKVGIVVKQMKTVETLGSATVICTDKTGTITENKMSLARLWLLPTNRTAGNASEITAAETDLVRTAMWASEPVPFDPMEIALHQKYRSVSDHDERPAYHLIHEYPLSGKPPMMTHIFENAEGARIIAAKGAPEAIVKVCRLSGEEIQLVNSAISALASEGYRVLGVGETHFDGEKFLPVQQEYSFVFKGLIAFSDPPKKNIREVLEGFYKAGIDVKIITGDNKATTAAIAKQISFRGYEKTISGEELMTLNDHELKDCVSTINIFTRMFPEAKLKIINALKANSEIVAMTGDGVNDGPALKAAHIGIAMGQKGTEIAKRAASLILVEDDLSKMIDAVSMGRRIYANLKKAIQYIISIHIPIILTVFIPLILGWQYPNIFSPVHVIFLELIMSPTCSIIYENEPIEKNAMLQPPKPFTKTFFNISELSTSIVQGFAITFGTLLAYQYAVHHGYTEALTRTVVFTVLIVANIFLTLCNRSLYYSIVTTIQYKNKLILPMIVATMLTTAVLLYVQPVTDFFKFQRPQFFQLLVCTGIGFCSVIWYDVVKVIKRGHYKKDNVDT